MCGEWVGTLGRKLGDSWVCSSGLERGGLGITRSSKGNLKLQERGYRVRSKEGHSPELLQSVAQRGAVSCSRLHSKWESDRFWALVTLGLAVAHVSAPAAYQG